MKPAINRTKVELKPSRYAHNTVIDVPINRTKVELKRGYLYQTSYTGTAINRTKVELKPQIVKLYYLSRWTYQSYQSGIETINSSSLIVIS